MKALLDFLPVIVFFVVYQVTKDIIIATAVLIPATILLMVYSKITTGKIDKMQWITVIMVVLLGGATVAFDNKEFIQWKPTVVYWLFAVIMLGSQLIGDKPIIQRLLDSKITLPDDIWRKLNAMWVAFFIFLGVLNIYVAYTMSEEVWVNFKLFGLLILMVVFLLGQGFYLSKHIRDEDGEV